MIAVSRENTAQIFTITTEENGNFAFSNLKLYDTAKLSVLAKTITGKPGKVILDSIRYAPKTAIAEPLAIDVYRADNPSRHNVSNDSLVAHMLEELTINETRLEERGSSTFGLADQVVTGQWIRSSNIQDVLDALQSKVSGLRVVNGFIRLGPPTSFGGQPGGNGEPLVVLDGVPANSFSDGSIESTVSLIRGLSPQDIERIEVLKYSNSSAYGSRGANGVIVITTEKNWKFQRFGERGRFEEIKSGRYSAVKNFAHGLYGCPSSHSVSDIPRYPLRNPAVSTGTEILPKSHSSSRLAHAIRIVVEGIHSDGRVVHGKIDSVRKASTLDIQKPSAIHVNLFRFCLRFINGP